MNAHLKFRLAVASERYALEELQRRASLMWEEDRAALLEDPDAIELPIDQITEGRTIVAEWLGEMLGFAVVLPRGDGEADLDGLFVEPKFWRKGIGRRLIDEAEKLASRDGASSLFVVANPRARDFYTACGYLIVGEVPTRFRSGYKMNKMIVPPG